MSDVAFFRGASLSGGQRQRLALARALMQKPAVLLLDEATSSLDAITERRVQESLDALRCTRIVIAHRLSTVVDAALILVMDQGRLVEAGKHQELLLHGGTYAELVRAQANPSGRASWRMPWEERRGARCLSASVWTSAGRPTSVMREAFQHHP